MPDINQRLQTGWQLHQAGEIEQAETVYRGVLAEAPRNPDALIYLGIAQFDQRLFADSVESYHQAISLGQHNPIAWNNLGNSYRMLGDVEQAEKCLAEALRQRPDYLSALKNRGTLWVWTGQIERGLEWYRQGLQVDPDNAELHRNLGVIYLLSGDFERGWPEYRWRWRMPGMHRPAVPASRWHGEDLAGKRILLYPEQGRGDAIQFVRMVGELESMGANVVLRCASEWVALFSSVPGLRRLLSDRLPIPAVDYHASLIEVVDVLYGKRKSIPYGEKMFAPASGYLTVSQPLIDYWQRWLREHASGHRVGINWQGNPDHQADVYRSTSLQTLRPLVEVGGVDWISLQYGHGSEQLEQVDFADSMIRLPEHVDRTDGCFTDTAAILKNLDLVITTDTAIAHLAGAVGTETWLLLGRVPDWRWGLEGETTPWYPSLRLFRQAEVGDWGPVVEAVKRRLQDKFRT